jgi:hypothetical protein
VVLAMMSAVVANRALRPRRRLMTSCTGETVWQPPEGRRRYA